MDVRGKGNLTEKDWVLFISSQLIMKTVLSTADACR